ncbi:hypothetical protein ACWC4A_51890 [Streptomyces mirabilis]
MPSGDSSRAAAEGSGGSVRRQRVRVPWRLVSSPHYQDVALSVYVKVAALAARPEGCQAKTSTIASYLGMSAASVDRGLRQLRLPGPDGVVELRSDRRTLPGGRGQSAVRTVRPMRRTEAFVWLPVAAVEDLTPRQFRAYALMAFAQRRGIALTEAELAASLLHHSGEKAGQAISVTAAGSIVDGLGATPWVTVQRRAGAQGRHRYIAHDIAPVHEETVSQVVQEPGEAAGDGALGRAASSQVGEGSGSPVGEGSLAYMESPRTDSPEDERARVSPAVGEVPVVMGDGPVDNPARQTARSGSCGGLALRAGENCQPSPKSESRKPAGGRVGAARLSYTGPELAMSKQIYAVLEPVHVLLGQVNTFVARRIAREVGHQLREGTAPERLRHRLTVRFAAVMVSDVRDPGRWLLGVALPRWGCGHVDCEAGTMWSSGRRCEVCAEVVADRALAGTRAERIAQELCPEHGAPPGPRGVCRICEVDDLIRRTPSDRRGAPLEPTGPPRGACGECGARIFVVGRAVEDGLCKGCREEISAACPIPPARLGSRTTVAAAAGRVPGSLAQEVVGETAVPTGASAPLASTSASAPPPDQRLSYFTA